MLIAAALLSICAPGPRDNCVVDGDSFWLAGERIRIADIDAPETDQAKCPAERERGEQAKHWLLELLNGGTITLVREGRDRDRYGRLLRRVFVNGRDVGAVLLAEGLVRPYDGGRRSWC